MKMIHLDQDFYNDLAQELVTLVWDEDKNDGVIELKVQIAQSYFVDVLFAFSAVNYSIAAGLESMNYLVLALDGSQRCSTDFDSTKLSAILDA